jgi:hypothetical protein
MAAKLRGRMISNAIDLFFEGLPSMSHLSGA